MTNLIALYDATVDQLMSEGMDRADATRVAILHIYAHRKAPDDINDLLRLARYSGQIETQTGAKPMSNHLSILKTEQDVKNFEARAAKEWSGIAKEEIRCEVIGEVIYAYGSELACLRLAYAFRDSKDEPRVANFGKLSTWYFSKVHGV